MSHAITGVILCGPCLMLLGASNVCLDQYYGVIVSGPEKGSFTAADNLDWERGSHEALLPNGACSGCGLKAA